MKVIAFVLAFKEKPIYPLVSLMRQTIKPSKIVIVAAYPSACVDSLKGFKVECLVIPPDLSLTVGERVGKALTIAFRLYLSEEYDYMLKLDSDVYFDETFIEENIKAGYDLMGRGAAMIIKVKSFIKVFNHKWPISPLDDVIVTEVFKAYGYKVLPWKWIKPAKLIREPSYDVSRTLRVGYELYRIGFPIVSELLLLYDRILKRRELAFIGHLVGYLVALLRREKKYPFSNVIYDNHRNLLINGGKEKILSYWIRLIKKVKVKVSKITKTSEV